MGFTTLWSLKNKKEVDRSLRSYEWCWKVPCIVFFSSWWLGKDKWGHHRQQDIYYDEFLWPTLIYSIFQFHRKVPIFMIVTFFTIMFSSPEALLVIKVAKFYIWLSLTAHPDPFSNFIQLWPLYFSKFVASSSPARMDVLMGGTPPISLFEVMKGIIWEADSKYFNPQPQAWENFHWKSKDYTSV